MEEIQLEQYTQKMIEKSVIQQLWATIMGKQKSFIFSY